jgi:diguanylate cyclase (GGDEF)-like protein
MNPETPPAPLALVVDDDAASRAMMRATLEASGFEVADCGDGAEGLAVFAERRPQLVILDVVMPGVDGFEVLDTLRKRPESAGTPVLMLTGLDDIESINRAFELGASDFATKPLSWALFGHRVRFLLRAHQTLLQLNESEARLADAQRLAHLGHWEWVPPSGPTRWSPQIWRVLGLPERAGEERHSLYIEALAPEDRERLRRCHQDLERRGGRYDLELQLPQPDGEPRVVRDQGETLRLEDGSFGGLRGTLQDVTELRRAERRLRFLANHDELTRLPNRARFTEELSSRLSVAGERGERIAVLCLDLDDYRRVNGTLGYAGGDAVLRQLAERLARLAADLATAQDTGEVSVARSGGDEFLLAFDGVAHAEDAARCAQRLREACRQPLCVEGSEIFLDLSIGIAVFPSDARDAEGLVLCATSAAYHARQAGGYAFYDASMQATANRRLALAAELRRALERDELRLFLQAQVDGRTQELVGAEALVRWQHPERGLLAPSEFIAFAEEAGLIGGIGEWVLRAVVRTLVAWREAGFELPTVAVNLSGRELAQPDLAERVARTLALGGPGLPIEFEITETALVHDLGTAEERLHELRALGVRVCLDDFGTGFSSLSHLRRFPIDVVKVDRSFVKDVACNRHDAAIVSALVALSNSLGVEIVGEGIDSEEQSAALVELGCHVQQGYLFSRPAPVAEFQKLLRPAPSPGFGCAALALAAAPS